MSIVIKWSGTEYVIDESAVNQSDTIADLKVWTLPRFEIAKLHNIH